MQIKLNSSIYGHEWIVDRINNAEEDIELIINSDGGSVMSGLQIINAIQQCKYNVTARIEVLCASVAAVIALSCDKVQVRANDLILLHNCWTIVAGNKEQLGETIDLMGKLDGIMQGYISEHCNDAEAVVAKMNAGDYWLLGDELAPLFNHCELVERNTNLDDGDKDDSIAASGSLRELVMLARKAGEAAPQKQEYVMSNELKELLSYDE